MRAANKNIVFGFGALFLLLTFTPTIANAQTFGGGSSSSLYSTSSGSTFQSPGGAQQGGVSAQGSNAALLQTSGVKVLTVTGAPAVQTTSNSGNELSDSSEVILLSFIAAVFALGVLFLLWRQIKRSY